MKYDVNIHVQKTKTNYTMNVITTFKDTLANGLVKGTNGMILQREEGE